MKSDDQNQGELEMNYSIHLFSDEPFKVYMTMII